MIKYVTRLRVIALLLGVSTFVMSCSNGNTIDTRPPKDPNYGGAVDLVRCDRIGGWVWDSANPNEDIKVDIHVDDKIIGTVPAKGPRGDLKDIGTSNYGFVLSMPSELKDGKPHAVRAKISGGTYEIKVWNEIQPTFSCNPGQ